jgi:hypothetical protein
MVAGLLPVVLCLLIMVICLLVVSGCLLLMGQRPLLMLGGMEGNCFCVAVHQIASKDRSFGLW